MLEAPLPMFRGGLGLHNLFIETTIAPNQQDKTTPEKYSQNLKIACLATFVEDIFSGTSPNTYKLQYQLGQIPARIMFRRV